MKVKRYPVLKTGTSDLAGGEDLYQRGDLYRELFENQNSLAEENQYQDFFDFHQNNTIGSLYSINRKLLELYDLDVNSQQIIDGINTDNSNIREELNLLQNQIQQNPEDQSIINQWHSAAYSLSNLNFDFSSKTENINDIRRDNALSVWEENEAFQAIELPASNEKKLNKIYLEVIVMEQRLLNDSDRIDIEQIARQCFSEGGRAVYQARNWHYAITGHLLDAGSCLESESLRVSNFPLEGNGFRALRVEPNPNQGNMTIRFDVITTEKISLSVFNILGKELKSIPLEIGQTFEDVSLEDQLPGVYFVTITQKGKVQIAEKFIIK